MDGVLDTTIDATVNFGPTVIFLTGDNVTGINVYSNGKMVASNAASPTAQSDSRIVLFGERTASAAFSIKAKIYLYLFWNRKLTAYEVSSITQNPWQLFAPASRNLPIDAGTVIPPPPIDVEGFWDETLTAEGWFDETLQAGGWFDTQLLDVVASSGLSGAVTETLTLSDSQAATATLVGAVAETLTFTDSQAGRATWPVAVSETLSLSDSQTGTLVFVGAVAETLSLTDSQAATATLVGAVAETLTLSDSQAATLATGTQAVAETLALSDSQTPAPPPGPWPWPKRSPSPTAKTPPLRALPTP